MSYYPHEPKPEGSESNYLALTVQDDLSVLLKMSAYLDGAVEIN
jgi:hypothetical protein